MFSDNKPQLVVVAGPNGAGKSTLTNQAYPELIKNTIFVNPDEIIIRIAKSCPNKTEAQQQIMAAREALRTYDACFQEKKSFSLETTLAGNTPLKVMQQAQNLNYHITLAYVGIESPLDSVTRVRRRVSLGGHDVPILDILRRYARSMENLPAAIRLADDTLIFDNSLSKHRLILFLEKGGIIREIYQPDQPDWLKQRLTKPTLQLGQSLVFQNK